MDFTSELEQSLRYLRSDSAHRHLERDPYWPKWDSPWWHMLLLHEMGLGCEIPARLLSTYVEAINRMPLKIFPIRPEDMPPGIDPFRGTPCHCQLGNVYQVLASRGVDVDQEIPWIRPWLLRYQMPDGGLSCDNDAYRVEGEAPSSMVGTLSVFEALLFHTDRPWTDAERVFLQKGAQFLMERKLMHGSSTRYNASEREDEADWLKLCFPRFYFYDVLRGLNALLIWSEKSGEVIPPDAVAPVVKHLQNRFPEGTIRNERLSFEEVGTLLPDASGDWLRKQPATLFPLLEKVSRVGSESPFLTEQWKTVQSRLVRS